MTDQTRPLTHPRALRAIAHPLRVRLYEILTAEGPATVSQLAEKLGGMVGTLSYHLRQLEAHGYIEEASELAKDRRERWWRAVPGGMRWSEVALEETPGGREAADAARRVLLGRQIDRLRRWNQQRGKWGDAWREAAFSTDMLLALTPAELRQFGEEISAVVHRWVERSKANGSADGARRPRKGRRRQVFFFAHAFPFDADSESDSR
jgi:DNA-binding transcriptional ArsR family regulator